MKTSIHHRRRLPALLAPVNSFLTRVLLVLCLSLAPAVWPLAAAGFVALDGVVVTGPIAEGDTATLSGNLLDPVRQPNSRFVAQLYLDLLARPVDSGGLNTASNALAAGSTRLQLAQPLLVSTEYRTLLVRDYYTRFLQRTADPVGLNAQVNLLASGATDEQVIATFVGSAEYFATRAGNDNPAFVNALFQDLLGRPADGAALSSFVPQLDAGTTRSAVASAVLSSTEYRQQLVTGFYPRFLRRTADQNGVNFFVNLLASGARDEDVIAEMVASNEYFTRATSVPYQVVVDWGDGAPETNSLAATATAFNFAHQFPDDAPTGTPSDLYAITVSLSGITGSASMAVNLQVTNVPPTFLSLTVAGPVRAGVPAQLAVAFMDPGVLDPVTLVVAWGDGQWETNTVAAGRGTFSLAHTYAFGGTFTVAATLTDDDTGSATQTTSFDVAPAGESSVALSSSQNPSVPGAAVDFSAGVSAVPPAEGVPAGTVMFYRGVTLLGSSPLAAGAAVFRAFSLPPGTNVITAVYSGDANFTGNTSAPVEQLVQDPPLPALTVRAVAGAIEISWPLAAADFRVESAVSLAPPSFWSDVPGPFQTNRATLSLGLPVNGAQMFFRLTRP